MTTVEIKANLQWLFFRDETSGRWIGVCDALKLTVEADTSTELRENIADGMNLLLRDLTRDNRIADYLQRLGWSMVGAAPSSSEDVRFDVPFELIAKRNHDSSRPVH